MSNPIRNVNQLNTLTSLSAYDVKEGGLHQIGDLHKAARQVADMFRNITSSGQLHIATRNAQVSTQIHKLIQSEANNIANGVAPNQALTTENMKQHNLNGLHALRDKVKTSDLSDETKQTVLYNIDNFKNLLSHPRSLNDTLRQSKQLLSYENIIFQKVNMGYDDTINNAMKTFLVENRHIDVQNEHAALVQLSKDLYRDGINLFMNQSISKNGIDGAIQNGTYGHKDAQLLRQAYENEASAENKNKTINADDPKQIAFYEEMMKDLFAGGSHADSAKNYKTYAPFFTSLMHQSGILRYIGMDLCHDLGLWDTHDLAPLGISMKPQKTFTEVKTTSQGYDIEMRGIINMKIGTPNGDTLLGDNKFSVTLHIPKGQVHPEDANPPKVTNETFIPEFTIRNVKFSHSVD